MTTLTVTVISGYWNDNSHNILSPVPYGKNPRKVAPQAEVCAIGQEGV